MRSAGARGRGLDLAEQLRGLDWADHQHGGAEAAEAGAGAGEDAGH